MTHGGEAGSSGSPLPFRDLNWFCPGFGSADGYGNSAEQIVLALERRGLHVTLPGIVARFGHLNAQHVYDRPFKRAGAVVQYCPPPHWIREPQREGLSLRRAFGFTMYERDQLPIEWETRLHEVEELWIPSRWSLEVFAEVSPVPVHYVPLGVDPQTFRPSRRQRGDKLRVLFFASYASEPRKGADLAMAAFSTAFGDRADVEMIVRSSFRRAEVVPTDPRIRCEDGNISSTALADYYSRFDVLLYPSRAEGFGLIPLEAMATGLPAIFTGEGGSSEYAEYGLPIGADRVVAPHGWGVARTDTPTPYGHWFEPRFDELVDRLRQVDREYDAVQTRAYADAHKIAECWSWDRSADAIIARLIAQGVTDAS